MLGSGAAPTWAPLTLQSSCSIDPGNLQGTILERPAAVETVARFPRECCAGAGTAVCRVMNPGSCPSEFGAGLRSLLVGSRLARNNLSLNETIRYEVNILVKTFFKLDSQAGADTRRLVSAISRRDLLFRPQRHREYTLPRHALLSPRLLSRRTPIHHHQHLSPHAPFPLQSLSALLCARKPRPWTQVRATNWRRCGRNCIFCSSVGF